MPRNARDVLSDRMLRPPTDTVRIEMARVENNVLYISHAYYGDGRPVMPTLEGVRALVNGRVASGEDFRYEWVFEIHYQTRAKPDKTRNLIARWEVGSNFTNRQKANSIKSNLGIGIDLGPSVSEDVLNDFYGYMTGRSVFEVRSFSPRGRPRELGLNENNFSQIVRSRILDEIGLEAQNDVSDLGPLSAAGGRLLLGVRVFRKRHGGDQFMGQTALDTGLDIRAHDNPTTNHLRAFALGLYRNGIPSFSGYGMFPAYRDAASVQYIVDMVMRKMCK